MITSAIFRELAGAVGRDRFLTGEAHRQLYRYDASGLGDLPAAVALPDSTAEVVELVRIARRHRVPLYPRGAGSGFTGGGLPSQDGVVVCLSRMNRPPEIDRANLTVEAEAGVITGDLHDMVERQGLFYPPDPSSFRFSTIGGNVAENAGGPRAFKYGVTRNYVLALEAVTGEGVVIRPGVRTVKGVAGYNVRDLFIGSEGTLGIVTRVTLRLLPLPPAGASLRLCFDRIGDAAAAVGQIVACGVAPVTLELIDRQCIACVTAGGDPFQLAGFDAILLVDLDGDPASVEYQLAQVSGIFRGRSGVRLELSRDREERARLWEIRRAVSPSLARLNRHKVNEDVVVPPSRIPELLAAVDRAASSRGLKHACFGHAGDGNIHVNFMLADRDGPEWTAALEAVREVFARVLELGGTISGEHGIGRTKQPFLSMELAPGLLDYHRRLKAVFDPDGIMNPDKIWEPR